MSVRMDFVLSETAFIILARAFNCETQGGRLALDTVQKTVTWRDRRPDSSGIGRFFVRTVA